MATQGKWLGQWPGEWYGRLSTDPNLLAAQVTGSGTLSASLTYVSSAPVAALYGSGTLTAQLSFTAPVVDTPRYYSNEKEVAHWEQLREEDDVIFALIQQFVLEEA